MLTHLFFFILLLHGLIHFMGFAKAFEYSKLQQLTKDIPKSAGVIWLVAALLFIATAILYLLKKESWPVTGFLAVVLSQIVIVFSWKDAKYGSIANIIVCFVAITGWAGFHFESQFRQDVKLHLQRTEASVTDSLTNADIQHLPSPVQKYLMYTGVVNQPVVKNAKILFEGEMREKGKSWFPFYSVQYNFFDDPARLFFMKARMFGVTVPGYHDYQSGTARMNVKLFGLFRVMQAKGEEMNKAETVTLFNDMCLFAPATLADKRIQWESIDDTSAKATFTNGNNEISAILYFNEKGQLVNFISDDRYAIPAMKQYRFSTPVRDYKLINGRNIPRYGEAIWHYPDGAFIYGKFYLKSIEYNISGLKP